MAHPVLIITPDYSSTSQSAEGSSREVLQNFSPAFTPLSPPGLPLPPKERTLFSSVFMFCTSNRLCMYIAMKGVHMHHLLMSTVTYSIYSKKYCTKRLNNPNGNKQVVVIPLNPTTVKAKLEIEKQGTSSILRGNHRTR